MLLVTATLTFAHDKRIILGSFTNSVYASKALIKANNVTQKDSVIKKLMNINTLTIRNEKIGKYYTITVSYLKTDVQLFRTIKAFSKYYKGVYVLPPYQEKMLEESKQKNDSHESATSSQKETIYTTTLKIRIQGL